MRKALKNLLRKPSYIEFTRLSSWVVKNLEISLENEISSYATAIKKLKNATNLLKNEECKKDSCEKAKKEYVKQLLKLQKSLVGPTDLTYASIINWLKKQNKTINDFTRNHAKEYTAFKSERLDSLPKLRMSFKNLKKSLKVIYDKIQTHNLEEVEELHKNIKSIIDIESVNKKTKKELAEIEKRKFELIKDEGNLKNKIESTKIQRTKDRYIKELDQVTKEFIKLSKQTEKLEFQTIKDNLVAIEKILKKLGYNIRINHAALD